jgi:uncharacterized protein YbaP (TraB family)
MHMLLRRIGAFLIAILSCLSISASAREAPSAPALELVKPPVPMEVARPALWKISDADTTIYLFGTIHALPQGIDWFGGPLQQAFDGADQLVTEILPMDPSSMQASVVNRAALPAGQTLRALLSPEQKAEYEGAMASLGVQAGNLDRVEPWFAALYLVNMSVAREGYGSTNGVETALNARAKALGRSQIALETVDFQLGVFDALPLDVQKRYLNEVAASLPETRAQLDAMIGAWKRGDADELARVINSDEDDPVMMEALLFSRNRTWAGWIKERMGKPGTIFVAVGAGHLAGPGSVQQQLERMGIASTRVQ